MTGRNSERTKLIVAVVCLALAAVVSVKFCPRLGSPDAQVYFYDLSEDKLFTAAQDAVPPIKGINDDEEDGVRALVVAPPDARDDESRRRIAYLERYSPALKQQFEASRARKEGDPPPQQAIGRGQAQAHTFVKRVEDTDWVPMTSPMADRIIEEWQEPGPDGQVPLICLP